MGKLVPLLCLVALVVADAVQAEGPDELSLAGPGLEEHVAVSFRTGGKRVCRVTRSALPSRRYGSSRLWVHLPAAGILYVQRNQPEDGMFGTKLGWIPDRERSLKLRVSGRRLDGPGQMTVRGVSWGHSSTGKGSWASAVAFPQPGCWRITGRAGPTTVSYVVRVVVN